MAAREALAGIGGPGRGHPDGEPCLIATLRSLLAALTKVDLQPLETTLVRQVLLEPLVRGGLPPDFLFTSGRPNRYNPAGVECVYFSGDEQTASAERTVALTQARARQPFTSFCGELHVRLALDLAPADPAALVRTLRILGLDRSELDRPWRRARRPTPTQLLGLALVTDGRISAIRYPSVAARAEGLSGVNVVIYKRCVRAPDSLEIVGPSNWPKQVWS